jgi:uncharacterized protein (DUF1499 family)
MSWYLMMVSVLISCSTMKPQSLGIYDGRLTPCPASPNCVCSDDTQAGHAIEPYHLAVKPQEAWKTLVAVVTALPRTEIVVMTPDYLRAESQSLIFRFVDDVEFHLQPEKLIIGVRSASRLGYWDLGVNRRRIEHIRELLRSHGVVK